MTRRIALVALLVLVAPASVSAQSLLHGAGLGVPTDPLDARTRALGGVGIGLQGPAILGSDPAAAANFLLPTLVLNSQASWVDYQRESGDAGSFKGTRFPNMGIAYPLFGTGVVTFSFESFLDQRYQAERPVMIDLGEGEVEATDRFSSTGGVSQVRLAFAANAGRNVQFGVSAGRYTGSVTRRLERLFPAPSELSSALQVERYQSGGLWAYSGTAITGGATVLLGTVAQATGSFTWSSSLKATPSLDTEGSLRRYDLPLQLRLGASAVLAPGLSINAGFTTADWSVIDEDLLEGSSTGRADSYGVGLELSGARFFARPMPLRFGYRKTELPFALGPGSVTESMWTGGLGMSLSQIGDLVRAGIDLAVEKGDRVESTLSESFWRATLTVKVSGY